MCLKHFPISNEKFLTNQTMTIWFENVEKFISNLLLGAGTLLLFENVWQNDLHCCWVQEPKPGRGCGCGGVARLLSRDPPRARPHSSGLPLYHFLHFFIFSSRQPWFMILVHVFFLQGGGQIQSSHTQILRCRLWNQLVHKLQAKQVQEPADKQAAGQPGTGTSW